MTSSTSASPHLGEHVVHVRGVSHVRPRPHHHHMGALLQHVLRHAAEAVLVVGRVQTVRAAERHLLRMLCGCYEYGHASALPRLTDIKITCFAQRPSVLLLATISCKV